jgi:hypothetical protein
MPVPTIVAVGAAEPPLWIEQSQALRAKLRGQGADVPADGQSRACIIFRSRTRYPIPTRH